MGCVVGWLGGRGECGCAVPPGSVVVSAVVGVVVRVE